MTGVLRPDFVVAGSFPSTESRLDRKNGVFERDLDLNPETVEFSMVLPI